MPSQPAHYSKISVFPRIFLDKNMPRGKITNWTTFEATLEGL